MSCKFCELENWKTNKEIINKDFEQNYLYVDIKSNIMHVEDNYDNTEIEINYCPMCGRKL